jgi:hypothetical protein
MGTRNLIIGLGMGMAMGGAAAAIAQTPMFPAGHFSGFLDLEWKSSCSKPIWPFGRGPRAAEEAQEEYSAYVECLERQAKADSAYAANAVYEQAKKELMAVQNGGRSEGWLR